jgi:2-keto-4-pentenoate hydratase
MTEVEITTAVAVLAAARRGSTRIAALNLPAATVAEGHAIQDKVAAVLGEEIGGFKANAPPGQPAVRGAIYARTIFSSPASIAPVLVPDLAVEGEIAFRFLRELPPRDTDYSREEVARASAALPAVEVVSGRLADWRSRPAAEQLADCLNNGALVTGSALSNWAGLEIANLRVATFLNGEKLLEQTGGHPTGDPLGVAVALVNIQRHLGGVKTGQLVTTGSCTGIQTLRPGDRFRVRFEGLGSAELVFEQ